MESLELHYSRFRFNDDEFYEFCQQNGDLKLERNANGTILIMPNTGGKTGDRNSEVNFQLRLWNKQHKMGTLFDSSTAFKLPSTAVRSADGAFPKNAGTPFLSKNRNNFRRSLPILSLNLFGTPTGQNPTP